MCMFEFFKYIFTADTIDDPLNQIEKGQRKLYTVYEND